MSPDYHEVPNTKVCCVKQVPKFTVLHTLSLSLSLSHVLARVCTCVCLPVRGCARVCIVVQDHQLCSMYVHI